ncbi:MAG: chain length-determining protein [Alphaproteobacteria bacterium]|nr:MAG: chain length-determining protein [Alphaproteobacteria bacterium]
MNEVYQQLISILYGIWQRRNYALITAWVVTVIGWFAVAQIPNQYEASARIYVDTQSMLNTLMKGMTANTDVLQQLNMVRQTLISRPNMEKVVRMTDLDLRAKNESELEAIILDLQKRISLQSSGVNLFKLGFEDKDPELSKKVVQSLLTLFVEANIGASRKDLAGTRRFLDEQIRKHEQELAAAERRKAEFQQKNLGFLPGESSYFDKLQEARSDLVVANAALEEAKLRRDELNRHLKMIPPYVVTAGAGGVPTVGGGSDLPQRIAAKQRRLDELRERGYKDQHPDVVIMKETIEALRKEYEREQRAMVERLEKGDSDSVVPGSGMVPNPVYEQLKVRLIEMETQIASLRGRLEQKQQAVEKLEAMAQRVPEVEAEMARLNRDYNIIKANYEKLLERRESARMAQDLETKTDGVQIRVIDPPQVPQIPSSPNRLLLLTGVLLLGLGAGIAVAFLLSQLHTTFPNVQRLRDSFSLPVLGSISALVSERERRMQMRNMVAFGIGAAGLFGAYTGVILIEMLRGNILVS